MSERKNRRLKSGFTLIEVLLVVVIIGILAALVGPSLVGRAGDAELAAARAEIAAIKTAIRVYEMDMGSLPPNLDALTSNPGGTRWQGPYLDAAPVDPWGNAYVYTRGDRTFDVTSTGLNRQNN